MTQPQIQTITDLTDYISSVFDRDSALQDVRVTGEVSNAMQARSGHWYFTLKDSGAQLRCVMFKFAAMRQAIEPIEGNAIQARGRVQVYKDRGEYQLVVDQIRPAGGLGDLYQRFEQLKQQLEAEGLFEPERKRPLPAFPHKIGVVTSPDAAAFQDILNVLRRRFPLGQVIISPTLVQGTEAPAQIVRALIRLNQRDDIDVILVARGGGSIEDLWAFNDETVARTVAASNIPTVSGVGHETDFTLVDFVSDYRAPTPSAAAEVITPDLTEIRRNLTQVDLMLNGLLTQSVSTRRDTVNQLSRTLALVSPQRTIAQFRQSVDDRAERLTRAHTAYRLRLTERLTARISALESANPDALLKRGYAMVRQPDGSLVRSVQGVNAGDALNIRLQDGQLTVTVKDKRSDDNR